LCVFQSVQNASRSTKVSKFRLLRVLISQTQKNE